MRRATLLAAAALLTISGAGCAGGGNGGGEDESAGFNPFAALVPNISVEQERVVGAQADAQIRAQLVERGLLIDDPIVAGWINDLGQSLVAELGDTNFQYHFRVIQEDSLNAFALPGGYIFFHSGTILGAHDLEELVGVLAHEIAHSRRHHWARSVRDNAIPNLVANLVGIGLTAATGEAAPMIVAQGVSQSLQLAYTRELEAEADQVGTAFMVRAGYDPMGMAVFFERLVAAHGRPGAQIPPYLLSHPRADVRAIDAAERARQTTIAGTENPALRARFRDIQARLGLLAQRKRTTLLPELPPPDRAFVESALQEAKRLAADGDEAAAIARLTTAEEKEPNDPRLPFHAAELHESRGDLDAAVAAYHRAMVLDPTRALLHFRLGKTHRALGDDGRAVFHLEQAQQRFTRPGPLPDETARMLKRLTFPVLLASGMTDAAGNLHAKMSEDDAVDVFPADAEDLIWWGRVDPAWNDQREELEARWQSPSGEVVHRTPTTKGPAGIAVARLEGDARTDLRPGIWRVELWLDEEPAGRTTFRVTPSGPATEP